MKILRTVLLCVISFSSLVSLKAQTADDIVHKWEKVMGGREKLASIKTVYSENELTIMNNPTTSRTYTLKGKGYKSETDFSGQKIIDCYTVNGGWSVNPLAGQPTAVSMPASQAKLAQFQLEPAGPLFDYAAKGSKVELLGKENVNGVSAYKLNLTTADGTQAVFFINDSSYYILKQIVKLKADGQDVEISTAISDYRKTVDGFVLPFSYEVTLPGLTVSITCKKIEVNKEIDPAIFDMPKS
jgi:outer membrane lipoprotein-sorting protein